MKYAEEEKVAPENEAFLRVTTAESSPATSGTATPKVHASDEALMLAPAKFDVEIDPWALPEIVQQDDAKCWAGMELEFRLHILSEFSTRADYVKNLLQTCHLVNILVLFLLNQA